MHEASIQRVLLARLRALRGPDGKRLCYVWRANTGVASASDGRFVRFGHPGQADISGVLRGGRRLEIEVKGPRGRQTPEQLRFEALITAFGGLYILARDVESTIAAVIAAAGSPRAEVRDA